jgi:co-chaperonin GroES (HSP10)
VTQANNPHYMKLTYGPDLATPSEIVLTEGCYRLIEYNMKANKPGDESDITERVVVAIAGSDHENTIAKIRALSKVMESAWHYSQVKTGDRVYVYFQAGGSGGARRSEVVNGNIDPGPEALNIDWVNEREIEVVITLTRKFYWEAPSIDLPLANDYAYVGGTTGLHVYNRCDPTDTPVAGEVVDVGDGSATYGGTFAHIPVKRSSVVISYTIGGAVHTATDNGYGVLSGSHIIVGVINYITGVWSLTFDTSATSPVVGDHIDDGDGVTEQFNTALSNDNVVPTTIRLRYTQGGNPGVTNYGDGAGAITGPPPFNVGAIVYASGVWNPFYDFVGGFPPDNATPIYADYSVYSALPDFGVNITAAYTYLSAGGVNYVDVLPNDIDGTLPAPAVVTMQNEGAAAYNFFVGHNVFSDPANLAHICDAVGTPDVNCNGGAYHDMALTGAEALLDAWYLYPADDWAGAWFQIVARFRTAPTAGTRVRVRAGYGSVGTPLNILDAPWKELTTDIIQELGALRLPPWKCVSYATPAVVLALYGYITSGGGTLELDFLQTTPTDSYRAYKPGQTGVYVDNLHNLIDDGVEDQVYHQSAGGIPYGDYVPYGGKMMLWPGRVNRLYFLVTEVATAPIAHDSHIFLSYRQRRATL